MYKKDAGGGTIFILLIILAAWCPWLSKDDALQIYRAKTEQATSYAPACTFELKEETLHKVLFGYLAKVTYDCTVVDVKSLTAGENNVFVSFIKVAINMPHPVIR